MHIRALFGDKAQMDKVPGPANLWAFWNLCNDLPLQVIPASEHQNLLQRKIECQYPNIRGDLEGLCGPEWPWGGAKGQAEPVWAGHHAAGVGPHRRHQDMDGMSDIVVACAWAHNIAPAWSRPCRAWTGRGRWPVQLHDITLNYMQLHGESLQGITRNYMLITGDYTPLHACILQAITSNYMHVMACNEHVMSM